MQNSKHDHLVCSHHIEEQIGMAIQRDPAVSGPRLYLLEGVRKAPDPLFDSRYARFEARGGSGVLLCKMGQNRVQIGQCRPGVTHVHERRYFAKTASTSSSLAISPRRTAAIASSKARNSSGVARYTP